MSYVSYSFTLSIIHFAILTEKQKQALSQVLSVQFGTVIHFVQNKIAVGGRGKRRKEAERGWRCSCCVMGGGRGVSDGV